MSKQHFDLVVVGGVCAYQCGVPDGLVATCKKERDFPPGEEWRDRRVEIAALR